MAAPLPLEFLQSAAKHRQLPESLIEYAIAGRSNVGKSSLLNALANRKKLARTSKTPGATRLLNVYEMQTSPAGRWLVDLPGYGYAKASKNETERWRRMIEDYLIERDTLAGVLVLIDGAVGPTPLDLQMVEWLDHIELPMQLVATKADKVKPSRSKKRRTEVVTTLGVPRNEVLWVSAASGSGVAELRGRILELLDPEPHDR